MTGNRRFFSTDHQCVDGDKRGVQKLLVNRTELIRACLEKGDFAFPDKYSLLLDDYFRESYEVSPSGLSLGMMKHPYAIMALGGYGRLEQSLFSDIDILFLFKDQVPPEAESLVKEIIYPLWDAGFEVGHATRSVKECVRAAGEDVETLMAILDGRFICGMSTLFVQVMENLKRKVVRSRSEKILSLLVDGLTSRHERFGEAAYLLEPNLKEGSGGLRDFHAMLWISRIQSDLREPRDLEYLGHVSEKEFESLMAAVSFLHQVRNRLHFLAGRKCDQLHMDYQKEIAQTMSFRKIEGKEAVEGFLGALHGNMAAISQQLRLFLSETGVLKTGKRGRAILGKGSKIPGITVTKRNTLDFQSLEAVLKTPTLLMQIFRESLHLSLPLSVPAKRVIKELAYLIPASSMENRDVEVKILEETLLSASPENRLLDEMMDTGLLCRLIPEMEGVLHLIQYDSYHIYPVCRHSLKTVETLVRLGSKGETDPLFYDLYHELADKRLLVWAALLHDIGKGAAHENHADKGATLAESVLERLNYPETFSRTVSFLVKNHLLLIKTATRRDINDEETILSSARKIGDIDRLKMLYLLSVADSISTGDKAWNDWTASLVRDFFLKILKVLKQGELTTRHATETIAGKKRELLCSREIDGCGLSLPSMVEMLPDRYLLYVASPDILIHLGLSHRLNQKPFLLHVKKDESSRTRIVTICVNNKPAFFSLFAGGFTLSGLEILDASVYVWKNNTAIFMFRVTPPKDTLFEEERWVRIEKNFHQIVSDPTGLAPSIFNKISKTDDGRARQVKGASRVHVDNEVSSFYTLIEVIANDFPGLLFIITHTLHGLGLEIHVAKIGTKRDQVVDTFYVRRVSGEKIEPGEAEKIQKRIVECIEHRVKADV